MRLAMLLGVAALLSNMGCGRPEAVSSSMSKDARATLSSGLAKLDATLREKTPFVTDSLAPPATDDELKLLWSELGGAQIECLETWYRWHNGCTSPTIDLIPLGRMLPIAEAIADRQQIQSIPFIDAKLRRSFKILEDLAGDGFYLDVTSPNPHVFYCMIEDPYPRYFGSMAEFIGFIESVHAAGLATKDEHGVDFDFQRYQEMEAAYLQSVGSE
jgi:hypothetical protein